jgi:hypothetical protein
MVGEEFFVMTKLLEKAFAEASKLPEPAQDALAAIVLREIESEERWDELFARPGSADVLSRMADEALAEAQDGRVHALHSTD